MAKAETGLLEARRASPDPSQLQRSRLSSSTRQSCGSLIDGAVSASAELVRLLNEALREVAPPDQVVAPEAVRPTRHRQPRRKPIRLPGGVLAGSIEAAEFLLRTKDVETLIDGYNVAKLGWPTLDLDQQREQMRACRREPGQAMEHGDDDRVRRRHHRRRSHIDAAASCGSSIRRRACRPTTCCAPRLQAADVAKPVVVVTNDRAIITDVAGAGANTVSSDDFLTILRR